MWKKSVEREAFVVSKRQNKTGGRAATTGHIAGDYALAVGMPPTPAPKGWKWTQLTDVARLETGHTPSRKFPEYWDGDVPWVGIRDATGNHGQTIHETNQYTTDLGIENSSARILPANTVCLSRTASVGYVIVMGRPMATSQDFVNWVCSDDLDYRFLMYVLLAEKRSFLRFAHGTTHQTIYFPEVKAFHICLPPIEEQRAIASILGALDDKIELNCRMNATLESLARAIFKSWFVDFDPVHVNAGKINAGQMPASSAIPTTHDPKVLDLFPSTFQDSELGPIPQGWNVEPVGKHVAIKHGYAFKGKFFSKEPTRDVLLTPGNFAVGGGFKGDKLKYYEGTVDEEYILSPGDLLVTMTDLSKAGDTLGYPAFVPESSKYRYLHNQRLGRVYIESDSHVGVTFIHESFRTSRYRSHVLGTASGSTVKHSSPTRIRDHKIAVATPDIHEVFEERVFPLIEGIARNDRESMRLSAVRDQLLPQLLSGELPVAESLTEIEEVLA